MHQNMHQRIPPFSSYERFLYKSVVLLVPGGGVEPPRPCDRRILSPLRLPVNYFISVIYSYHSGNCVRKCVNFGPFSMRLQPDRSILADLCIELEGGGKWW